MTKIKYTIKCVNNGNPFEMPDWTVDKHENALAKVSIDQEKNKWNDKKAENEWKYYVIHESLLEIDPNCRLEDLKKFLTHPVTLIELFNAVYNAGRQNIYYVENFRKGRKTPSNKK